MSIEPRIYRVQQIRLPSSTPGVVVDLEFWDESKHEFSQSISLLLSNEEATSISVGDECAVSFKFKREQ